MPLNLSVKLSGTDDAMTFKDIKVTTDDQRLDIVANGNIKHLTDKERLAIRFHVNKMTAKGNVKREVINQFAVKKFMMKQQDALGTIGYTGDIASLRQQEKFSGLLRTAAGAMNLTVTLNEATKYVSGSVQANVSEAHYKKISVKNIFATIESDGAKAEGDITQKNKHINIGCAFSFDDTDALHKMKIKPSVKINTFKKRKK